MCSTSFVSREACRARKIGSHPRGRLHPEQLDDLLRGVERSLDPALIVRVRLATDVQRHRRVGLEDRRGDDDHSDDTLDRRSHTYLQAERPGP